MKHYVVMSEEEGQFLKDQGLIKWAKGDFKLRHECNNYSEGLGLLCNTQGFMGNDKFGRRYFDTGVIIETKVWHKALSYNSKPTVSDTPEAELSLFDLADSLRVAHETNSHVPWPVRKRRSEEEALAQLIEDVKKGRE